MSTTGYEHQAVDHDASIRAERPDPDQVEITITHGEDEPTSITMWAEDFEAMAGEVLNVETDVWPFAPGDVVHDSGEDADHAAWLDAAPERTVVSDCDGDEWTRKNDGLWWMNRGRTARAGSIDLHATVGPLTVVSVPTTTMTGPEVTAAVRRAAVALGTATPGDQAEQNARDALTAGLNGPELEDLVVETLASAGDRSWALSDGPKLARRIRTAILGGAS